MQREVLYAPFSNTGPALSRWALVTSWTRARRERLVDVGISLQPSGRPWFPGSQDVHKKDNIELDTDAHEMCTV